MAEVSIGESGLVEQCDPIEQGSWNKSHTWERFRIDLAVRDKTRHGDKSESEQK